RTRPTAPPPRATTAPLWCKPRGGSGSAPHLLEEERQLTKPDDQAPDHLLRVGLPHQPSPTSGQTPRARDLPTAHIKRPRNQNCLIPGPSMVGATGFEPATTCTPSRCATRLRYAPGSCSAKRRTAGKRDVPAPLGWVKTLRRSRS